MGNWLDLGASAGMVNLDQVTHAELYVSSSTAGDVQLFYADGSYSLGSLGSTDAIAWKTLMRLTGAVDVTDYV